MADRSATTNSRVAPLLSARGVSKRFGAVPVLRGVDLDVARGEVHALIGENGAGKSTLMHILCGARRPDAGTISFDGRDNIQIDHEHVARELGISIVFQERSLFAPLSIAENIFAGRQPVNRLNVIRRREMHAAARTLLAEVGLDIDPRLRVADLSPAHQQLVEIAKALSLNPRLIIFDEPTAALTDAETRRLFAIIDRLRRRETSVIYISHRLEEIFEIADRVTVLKDGKHQATRDVACTTPRELVALMVGRDLDLTGNPVHAAPGPAALRVTNLTDDAMRRSPRLSNVSFVVHHGEIVALAGLAGAGRTETALSIFGERPLAAGSVELDGRPVRIRSTAEAMAAGLGYVPEDRKDAGLFLDRSIADNIAAAGLRQFGDLVLDDRKVAAIADSYRKRLGINCVAIHQPVGRLSGGNQQKTLLARWLFAKPKVLIVDEPTRGVDVGARAEVHRLLSDLASQGTAVLVISSDLPEVLALADRVVVMAEGRVTGELSRAEATEEEIIRLASRVA